MPIYTYSAKRGPGETVTGEIEAVSQKHVFDMLEKMGLVPVAIAEKNARDWRNKGDEKSKDDDAPSAGVKFTGKVSGAHGPARKKIFIPSVKVRSGDMDTFTRQLASLMKSSVPMLRSLSLISQQTESKVLKEVVADLAVKIKDGKMLSEAMMAYPGIFNNMYYNMVRSGEKSGTLDQILYRLAEHREREQELKQKIQAAMAYPTLVICVGVGTVFVMLTYFLPKFMFIFKGMKQELPVPTKILMGITNFMSAYWYLFLIAAGLIFAVFGRVKAGSRKKVLLDMIKMRIPFAQKFTLDAEIAKFSRSLGVLLKNGLPVHESLELATDILDNDAMKEALRRAGKSVIDQGLRLSESFGNAKIFPGFVINMISVGEESGRLAEALEDVATVYEREVNQSIRIMSSLLEPILILTVGAIVGFIVFAMLLPVFNIGMVKR